MNPETWFKGRTYHHKEFCNLSFLQKLKEEKNVQISLGIPTLNEERTIGKILQIIKENFLEKHQILDQVALIDSHSTDETVNIAQEAGFEVYYDDEIRPDLKSEKGKGEALWKSLFILKGDIIIWIDADIENFHPRFLYGIIGPLLYEDEIGFVKGFYQRPLKTEELLTSGGGRVTEILVRPLLNLFYPELAYFFQPISGEYGGKREILRKIPFYTDYAVEAGMLIEIWKKFGLNSMAQVNLETRVHRNQPTANLGKMSFAILQCFLDLMEKEKRVKFFQEFNFSYLLPIIGKDHHFFDKTKIKVVRRPPFESIKN